MSREPRKIKVEPDSELASLLAEADAMPLLIEKDGELYRLDRMNKKAKVPSPEEVTRSRAGILKAAGSWKDIDTEAFKAYAYERRRTANRPSIRL